jgi:hypothetical protein
MATSRRRAETIALGRRLVEELGLQTSVDTTRKWMAHYLAELMSEVERAPDRKSRLAAEKRCCDIILRLWEERDRLPKAARPLGRIQAALDALIALKAERDAFPWGAECRPAPNDPPWLEFARDYWRTAGRTSTVAFITALLELGFGYEKSWLESHPTALNDSERELLSSLNWCVNKLDAQFESKPVPAVEAMPPEAREQAVLNEIGESLDRQNAAFLRLKQQLTGRRVSGHRGRKTPGKKKVRS